MYLSIEFQENYKRLDCLCKDSLSSNEGVSEYIRQMESTSWVDRRYVNSWEDDYKMLKHVRWIRNQLAHEVGTLEAGICQIDDLNYIKDFYNRILNGTDPFTCIRKAKEIEQERQTESQLLLKAKKLGQEKQKAKQSFPPQKTDVPNKNQQELSFWKKIATKIKNLFGK